MALVDIFKNKVKELEETLVTLYNEQSNAGVGTYGDYQNKIDQTERQIREINRKIKFEELESQPVPKLLIYVVSGTTTRMKNALGSQLYEETNPSNHDEADSRKWRPFLKEDKSIQKLIEDFRSQYEFKFIESYLEGEPKWEQLSAIETNGNNTIAIIDLLTLDEENMVTALRFDTSKVYRVIIPFCYYLPDKLKDFMKEKSKKAFKYLHQSILDKDIINDLFQPEASGQTTLWGILKNAFNQKQRTYNTIKDKTSDASNMIRTLGNPSFS